MTAIDMDAIEPGDVVRLLDTADDAIAETFGLLRVDADRKIPERVAALIRIARREAEAVADTFEAMRDRLEAIDYANKEIGR